MSSMYVIKGRGNVCVYPQANYIDAERKFYMSLIVSGKSEEDIVKFFEAKPEWAVAKVDEAIAKSKTCRKEIG
jgi:hypothetical protein